MKRILSIAIAILMLCTCVSISASARASLYLTKYSATMAAGSTTGELRISYNVLSSQKATSIGVSKIVIYTSSGTKVTTITGSTSNGLMLSSGSVHSGTYSYKGTSGTSYYAEVTVFAGDANGSDSRTITTSTVKAP